MYINNRDNGFSLIEILVVIAIIGGLTSILLPNLMGVRERARDAARKSDLKQIQKALEMYKLDQTPPSYPLTANLPTAGNIWQNATGTVTYMNKVPGDPNRTPVPASYSYTSPVGTDNLKYILCACIENVADTEVITGNCVDGTYVCTTGKKYVLTEP